MVEIWFYHLERSRLDQVLPDLLEKTLAKGWRALVRSPSPDRLAHLDEALWTWRDDSFLAHGAENGPFAAGQPILLGGGDGNPNNAKALFLLDGAECADLAPFERCVVIFDGKDETALAAARASWSKWRAAGHQVVYWRQGERGGWERQP